MGGEGGYVLSAASSPRDSTAEEKQHQNKKRPRLEEDYGNYGCRVSHLTMKESQRKKGENKTSREPAV